MDDVKGQIDSVTGPIMELDRKISDSGDVVELRVFKEVLRSNPLQPLNGGARTDPEPPRRSLYTMSDPA